MKYTLCSYGLNHLTVKFSFFLCTLKGEGKKRGRKGGKEGERGCSEGRKGGRERSLTLQIHLNLLLCRINMRGEGREERVEGGKSRLMGKQGGIEGGREEEKEEERKDKLTEVFLVFR